MVTPVKRAEAPTVFILRVRVLELETSVARGLVEEEEEEEGSVAEVKSVPPSPPEDPSRAVKNDLSGVSMDSEVRAAKRR